MTEQAALRVAVVGRGLPSPASPLLGCFELDQARALADAGASVVHAALDLRSVRRWRRWGFASSVDGSGVRVEALSVPLGALPTRLHHGLAGLAWRALYRRIVARHGRPDVVHAHFCAWGAAVAAHTPQQDRPLVVVTEHYSRLTAPTIADDLRWLAERAYRADRVLAVSSALARVIRDRFGVEAHVVGDVIDIEQFQPEPRTEHAGVRIISTGNLIARKRMSLLVDGFARLADRRDDVSLTIVGEGPEREALLAQVRRLGLDDRVQLPGRATRDELTALYRQHDLFAMLSTHETFGVVWAEALAAGLPVVAPRIPGPDEFVDETVGEWSGESPDEVAEALERVIVRLDEFDPAALRSHVSERFSPEAVAGQLLEVYRTGLQQGAAERPV
ncbi:glycosyltransferase [Aestuariimicrobium ganziense]|uniref:glycosyltransferase n=1 Tax=Aestuariimicrobium ganziense TaxID=2773677 RepID=UPI001944E883|nr:glycosyltransferase [Aestuariimicrobium ganziense]